jgi:hypothetical protein
MVVTTRPAWEQFTRLYHATREGSLASRPKMRAIMDSATFKQLGATSRWVARMFPLPQRKKLAGMPIGKEPLASSSGACRWKSRTVSRV